MRSAFPIPPGQDQGPDDYIARHGADAFADLVDRAEPADIVERVRKRVASANGDPDAIGTILDDLPLMLAVERAGAGALESIHRTFKKAGVPTPLVKRACRDAGELLRNRVASRAAGPTALSTFRIEGGGYVRQDENRRGDKIDVRLSEFTVELEEEVEIRYGDAPSVLRLDGTARLPGRPPISVQLDSGDLKKADWVYEKIGAAAIIAGGPARYSGVLEAIQRMSSPSRALAYGHTGFVTTGEGLRAFVHSGGAVGADGVRAELGPSLAAYRLSPTPSDDDGIRAAIRHSLRFLDTSPDHISFAVLGMIVRALLASLVPVPFALFLVGVTGKLKSTYMAAAMRHFGKAWETNKFEGFASTANYLERQLHLASDVVLVIDDLVKGPERGAGDVDAKAERIFRAVGNTAARGRCASDGSAKEPLRPRCALVVTAEHAVQGHSLNGRMLSVPFEADSVRRDPLREWKTDATSPSAAIAAFIELYILPSYDDLLGSARAEIEQIRDDEFAGQIAHPRTPENLANLLYGLRHFFAFCELAEAITADEHEALERRAIAGLRVLGDLQKEAVRQADPVEIFLELFASLVSQGKVRVHADGVLASASSPPLVAWHDPCHPGLLCIDASAAFVAVNRELVVSGRAQLPSIAALQRQLQERYFSEAHQAERARTQVTNPESRARVTGFRIPIDAIWAGGRSTAEVVARGGAYDVC